LSSQQQPNLFDTDPPPWELDDEAERLIASVVLSNVPGGPFDYIVPDALRMAIQPGQRVRVPFGRGNKTRVGYCVDLKNQPTTSKRLKEVEAVVDVKALLSPSMLRLAEWMAERYLCGLGQVIDGILPAGVRGQAGTREVTLLTVPTKVAAQITRLKLSDKQGRALRHLISSPKPLTPSELAKAVGCTTAPISALRKRGLVHEERCRVHVGCQEEPVAKRESHHALNDDQQKALDAILQHVHASEYKTVLIRGVTGSGKTEVYIRAIDEVVQAGQQAIVLVPEISLTPQTRQRFRARFDRVAVLHSHLSDVERHSYWHRIAQGEVQVVVGARSAIFAPTPHLGLIILDEEHEGSFKQGDCAPRYHARDVARYRASKEGVPLILGSATPSLESWAHAVQGRYHLVEMPHRVFDRPMPAVKAIDLRNEYRDRRHRGAISRPMHQAIHESLRDEGQVILLLNRRGFSTHIQCPACGEAVRCPYCDVTLTHHKIGNKAICHLCDYETALPTECPMPECRSPNIRFQGLGTQRLESEIQARFPDATCLRMDTDTMRKPGSHEAAFEKFRKGEVQILLGTQMIAKGLDFPNVTLVGVINADTALHLPDFRAAERTFQLVTQVAGRTGRGDKGGRVLIQTFSPDHPAIQAAIRHDFVGFAKTELPARHKYDYPPYTSMVRLVVRGPVEATAEEFAQHLAKRVQVAMQKNQVQGKVLGPTNAPIAKLRGKYRFHMLIKSANGKQLRQSIVEATQEQGIKNPPEDIQWIVDVDPHAML